MVCALNQVQEEALFDIIAKLKLKTVIKFIFCI